MVFLDLRFLIDGYGVIKIITKGGAKAFLVGGRGRGRGGGRRDTREEESTEGVNLGHLCFWLLEQKKNWVGFFLVKNGMERVFRRGVTEIESRLVWCGILKNRKG